MREVTHLFKSTIRWQYLIHRPHMFNGYSEGGLFEHRLASTNTFALLMVAPTISHKIAELQLHDRVCMFQ